MHTTTRRTALAAAGALAVGTLAAVTLRRKPVPTILTPAMAESVDLQPITVMHPTDPPAPPPAATFNDADGKPHSLAEFTGKGLLINLWATWCVPCVAEMPALQQLAATLAGDDILVLPMSSDRGGAEAVAKFYAAHDITRLPIWLDPKGAAANIWGARGLPTTIVIDRQGRERGRLEGAIAWSTPDSIAAIRGLM